MIHFGKEQERMNKAFWNVTMTALMLQASDIILHTLQIVYHINLKYHLINKLIRLQFAM